MEKVNTWNISEYEKQLQRALLATKWLKNPIPVAEVAEEFQVSKRTLYRRVAGTYQSCIESDKDQQWLSKVEEPEVAISW